LTFGGFIMKRFSILSATAAGALAVYFLDARQGRTRRARLREQVSGKLSHVDEASAAVFTDMRNRLQGLFAGMRTRMHAEDVPDEILAERVRAKVGRFLSHPGAVDVSASGGTTTLRGPVLKYEADRVVKAVRKVPGVRNVVDSLERYAQRGHVSSLQGGRPRAQHIDMLQQHWAPATRAVVGSGGALLAARGLLRRSPLALLAGALGAAFVVRAVSNMDAKRLLGQRGRRGIDFTKTITIAAPADEVFQFWMSFGNFPKFMRNVRSVRRNEAPDSWHWEVAGPLGTTVHWDAKVTRVVPNELIAWSTERGSSVEHAGLVRFQPEGSGTRVQVEMSYSPPAGAAGHAVAQLFGADPQSEMDEDLMRLKAYFETGKPAHDAAAARRSDSLESGRLLSTE
jgi:uncharacterized membrane protein